MLAPALVTPPAITPVSLAEVKAHLRVDHTDDDAMIGGLLSAAVAYFDGWTGVLGRCLVEQTWRQDFERACQVLPIPLAPVISIANVAYPDANGDPVAIDVADYALKVDAGGRGGVLLRAEAVPTGPVSVTYKAGYATIPEVPAVPGDPGTPAVSAQSAVPDPIKVAIKLHVQTNYDPMEPAARDSYQRAIDALVAPYRRVGV